MVRTILFLLTALVLAVPFYFLASEAPDKSYINTLYTSASIMFSIGMGIICTFNPERIKNKNIYSRIKNKVINLRNSFLFVFAAITMGYLMLNFIDAETFIAFHKVKINLQTAFILYYVCVLLISICYFIFNFLKIQKLTFEIHETD